MSESNRNSMDGRYPGDRRRSTRFPIRGAAWFQWQTVEGHWREGGGITRDMGKAGTFIETALLPPVSSQLKVVVTLSMGQKDALQVRLCGSGDVRHIQQSLNACGGYGAWVMFHTEATPNAG